MEGLSPSKKSIKACERFLWFFKWHPKSKSKTFILIQIKNFQKMNFWLRSYLFIFENTFMTKAIKFNYHKFNILITYAGEYL